MIYFNNNKKKITQDSFLSYKINTSCKVSITHNVSNLDPLFVIQYHWYPVQAPKVTQCISDVKVFKVQTMFLL